MVTVATPLAAVLMAGIVWAQAQKPPKPPRPGGPPAKAPGHPGKPGPKPPQAKAHPPGKAPRFVRHRHYWHPHYRRALSPKVWVASGYPYYVGGSDYTVVVPPASGQDPSVVAPTPQESALDQSRQERYVQIQELTDLVHEWRTMNEAPEFQDRIGQGDLPASVQKTLASIKEYNRQFDRTTRQAMQSLANGESAETELALAGECLQSLSDLFESLPGPKEGGASGQ